MTRGTMFAAMVGAVSGILTWLALAWSCPCP